MCLIALQTKSKVRGKTTKAEEREKAKKAAEAVPDLVDLSQLEASKSLPDFITSILPSSGSGGLLGGATGVLPTAGSSTVAATSGFSFIKSSISQSDGLSATATSTSTGLSGFSFINATSGSGSGSAFGLDVGGGSAASSSSLISPEIMDKIGSDSGGLAKRQTKDEIMKMYRTTKAAHDDVYRQIAQNPAGMSIAKACAWMSIDKYTYTYIASASFLTSLSGDSKKTIDPFAVGTGSSSEARMTLPGLGSAGVTGSGSGSRSSTGTVPSMGFGLGSTTSGSAISGYSGLGVFGAVGSGTGMVGATSGGSGVTRGMMGAPITYDKPTIGLVSDPNTFTL